MTKKKPMLEKIDKQVIMTGIVCITILECLALYLGFNGVLLRMVLIALAASAGVVIPADKIAKAFKR